MAKKDYGKILVNFRGKYKLTQGDVAKKVGVSVQTICGIEKGKQYPNALTRYAIEIMIKEHKRNERNED